MKKSSIGPPQIQSSLGKKKLEIITIFFFKEKKKEQVGAPIREEIGRILKVTKMKERTNFEFYKIWGKRVRYNNSRISKFKDRITFKDNKNLSKKKYEEHKELGK